MLLAIDVGNTQSVIGVFEEDLLREHWRISTNKEETADEFAITLSDLLSLKDLRLPQVTRAIISSVVPTCTAALRDMAARNLKLEPLVVGPGLKTGMPILYDNPHEVGADRIVNSVAGFERYGGPVVVVDFGTATTFDVVSEQGQYLGGAIAPGIEVSAEALFSAAERLSRVDLVAPASVIGRNTQESLQAGVIFGSAGLVDSLVTKIGEELNGTPKVVATGGLAELIVPHTKMITDIDPLLTLKGLKTIYDRNA